MLCSREVWDRYRDTMLIDENKAKREKERGREREREKGGLLETALFNFPDCLII